MTTKLRLGVNIDHVATVRDLLERAGIADVRASDFRRYGSERKLYNFDIDHADAYG